MEKSKMRKIYAQKYIKFKSIFICWMIAVQKEKQPMNE